jgi:hypothetical protein
MQKLKNFFCAVFGKKWQNYATLQSPRKMANFGKIRTKHPTIILLTAFLS